MMAEGLMFEVRGLYEAGLLDPKYTSSGAIGYKEFVAAVQGNCSIELAAEEVKKASRHYAKRQLTWFRRNSSVHWLVRQPGENPEEILARARQILREFDN